jgi:hypothetical protein
MAELIKTFNPVSNPEHYTKGGVECIDAMRDVFGDSYVYDFAVLNAYKYIWRCHNKENLAQDLEKAIWYLEYAHGMMIEADHLDCDYSDVAASQDLELFIAKLGSAFDDTTCDTYLAITFYILDQDGRKIANYFGVQTAFDHKTALATISTVISLLKNAVMAL